MTDATTSPERQEADARRYCEAHGYEVVGVARDTDVSGSVDPLDRPELGVWLRSRLQEWDVAVASKLDRVGRNARHIHALMTYLLDAAKNLQTVADSIDISTAVGRMIVYVMATVAEMELDSIRERNRGAAQHNIREGNYRGGVTPVGYRKVKGEGKGWRLTPDEDGLAPVIREIVERVKDGGSLSSIVLDLNDRGVQTHKDRQAEANGRESTGRAWTISNVRRILGSPALVGYASSNDAVVYDDAGEPVTITDDPLVSPGDYYAVRSILDQRAEEQPAQRRGTEYQLLTAVIHCATCGEPMYRLKGGPGRKPRYRCNSTAKGKACGNASVLTDEADEMFTGMLMTAVGGRSFVRREYVPGSDTARRISDVEQELETIAETVGRFPVGTRAHESMMARVDTLSAEITRLREQPHTEAGYRLIPTGETFAERWESLSNGERNAFLRSHDVRLDYGRANGETTAFHVLLNDLGSLLGAIDPALGEQDAREEIREARARR